MTGFDPIRTSVRIPLFGRASGPAACVTERHGAIAVAGRSAGGPASAIRLPHRIEAELISALGMGTNLDVAAADQSRPSATRAARLIHPMRRIFIPHLGKMGLAYFSPSECEVAHTSRGGHQTPTGPRRHREGRWRVILAGPALLGL